MVIVIHQHLYSIQKHYLKKNPDKSNVWRIKIIQFYEIKRQREHVGEEALGNKALIYHNTNDVVLFLFLILSNKISQRAINYILKWKCRNLINLF